MNELEYAAFLNKQMACNDTSIESMGKTDENVKDENTRKGLVLKGAVVFTGDVAIKVRDALARLGYKNLAYEGNLVKILPEDRRYEDFVAEALYWYLRQNGVRLKDD
jgi:hypothetical protein